MKSDYMLIIIQICKIYIYFKTFTRVEYVVDNTKSRISFIAIQSFPLICHLNLAIIDRSPQYLS